MSILLMLHAVLDLCSEYTGSECCRDQSCVDVRHTLGTASIYIPDDQVTIRNIKTLLGHRSGKLYTISFWPFLVILGLESPGNSDLLS